MANIQLEVVSHRSETRETVSNQLEAITPLSSVVASTTTTTTNFTLQTIKLAPNYSQSSQPSTIATQNSHRTSNNPSMSMSQFRFLSNNGHGNQSERSGTPSGKSQTSLNTIGNQQKVFIRQLPDAVDEIKLQYEGQRHVVMPGYMTSADILRNMLLCHTNDLKATASVMVQRHRNNAQPSLRERLIQQQQHHHQRHRSTNSRTENDQNQMFIPNNGTF